MQRFKPKRRIKKFVLLKTIFLIIIFIFLFRFIISFFVNHKSLVLKYMFIDEKYSYSKKQGNIFSKVYDYIKDDVINKPSAMLDTYMVYKEELPNNYKKNNHSKELKEIVINNEEKKISDDVLIYIYNTHQKEAYSKEYLEDYNVTPDVLLASHIMQEKLENSGIKTMVMEDDITLYLNDNKLDYSKSYLASRFYLKPAIDKYNKVKLFIDLHRDSANLEVTTTTIDNKRCAKIMFVIGKEYDTYLKNLELANYLNNKIVELYPELSRGVLEKEGYGVNGVYNQDLKDNVILIELGGDKNNIEEVTNTIDILVKIIGDYVYEE